MRMNKRSLVWIFIGLALMLSSCAKAPVRHVAYTTTTYYSQLPTAGIRHDLYHVVGPGETLWRISKMYDVNIDDIARVNNLRNKTDLDMGQRLLIPNAAPVKPVIALFKTDKWQYIIVHHSASDKGNALDINAIHQKKGWEGIGYHFVIDNGTIGKADGQIEASPRWIKQKDGAHCQASGMNYKGIGICLVGNFSKDRVSQAQMSSLVYLVNTLAKYYNIPESRIMGHGQVSGAATECPGKFFPWSEFRARLGSQ